MNVNFSGLKFFSFLWCINMLKCQNLQSPCPEIFQYRVNGQTNDYFGYVELRNLRVGQVVKLNINLSVAAQLPSAYSGSVELIGTRTSVFNDIVNGRPAKYKVNFPLRNPVPSVLEILVNGRAICNGFPARGQVVTTIKLEHTLYTQLQTQALAANMPQNVIINTDEDPFGDTFSNGDNSLEAIYKRPITEQIITQRPPVQKPPQRPIIQTPRPIMNDNRPNADNKLTCGQQGSRLSQLIFNGMPSRKGQWPWLAAIYRKRQNAKIEFICGGTLISNQHVVTAAHCLFDESRNRRIESKEVLVSLGRYNIDDFSEDNTQFVNAENAIPHPQYGAKEKNYDADIGIIILMKLVRFNEYIKPICLWSESINSNEIVGQKGSVTGWGRTEAGTLSSEAKTSEMAVIDRATCLKQDNIFLLSTSDRMFCAGGEGTGPCDGDSGSGFIMLRSNRWMLRGVVSHSLIDSNTGKCAVNKYAVYTDVAKFGPWIQSYMS